MVKGNFLDADDSYSLYTDQKIRDQAKAHSVKLQRALSNWHGKLTTHELFETAFILHLHQETVKSYIKHGSKRVNFKVHIALAILCYLECNYAHKK
jgi:hypothetical protein